MLPSEYRLRSPDDFRKVYKLGKVIRGRLFILRFIKSERVKPRFGIVPPRKVKNAVLRNRLKRRVRDVCRRHRDEIKNQYDIVINISGKVAELTRQDLESDLLKLIKRAGLFK